ncbi:hypothetical protein RhiirC2_417426 [Rhizophagus irregularis]|uniref:Uncharacterized protein n=1 Tax=Rhizophagus irregularis TaxID=588596 RepID=A0A2N1NZK4_9GLOM|nr:hypothetical protein RhiirC2_417426 [Rhizophagus irregularis]
MRIQVSFVIHRSSFILYSIFSNISLANGRTKSLRLIVSIIFFFKSRKTNYIFDFFLYAKSFKPFNHFVYLCIMNLLFFFFHIFLLCSG